jgi:lipopolysaccharide export system ATP-binding protein
MTEEKSKLTAVKLNKSFKTRKVVSNVSFHVESGEIVGLLGPNGAGKTTSFYMVAGLVKPDDGEVFINDKAIQDEPMFQRAREGLSYLAQEPSIFRRLTVEENILVSLEAQGFRGAERRKRLDALLEDFKLTHVRESFGMALSGGERRRVEIARALAARPKFLLLDEPFAGIDPIAVGDIQKLISELRETGIGVLITDHNVRETLRICQRAYILKDGEIQVSGSSDEITNSPVARKFYLGENFTL